MALATTRDDLDAPGAIEELFKSGLFHAYFLGLKVVNMKESDSYRGSNVQLKSFVHRNTTVLCPLCIDKSSGDYPTTAVFF